MGETATVEGAATTAGFAHMLAESAAGAAGADARLAAALRLDFESMLRQRLAAGATITMADAGTLVQHYWQALGHGSRRSHGTRHRSHRSGKVRSAAGAGEARGEVAAGLHRALYVERAAGVMQALVHELAARACAAARQPAAPQSTRATQALQALQALENLDRLEPQLARIVRLRWFAGLELGALAGMLEQTEPEVRRQWRKARAFLAAVMKQPAT